MSGRGPNRARTTTEWGEYYRQHYNEIVDVVQCIYTGHGPADLSAYKEMIGDSILDWSTRRYSSTNPPFPHNALGLRHHGSTYLLDDFFLLSNGVAVDLRVWKATMHFTLIPRFVEKANTLEDPRLMQIWDHLVEIIRTQPRASNASDFNWDQQQGFHPSAFPGNSETIA